VSKDVERELGAITATLEHIKEAQDRQGEVLEKVDERLRKVETKSALNGAVAGGVIAVAIGFIKDSWRI